MSDIVERLREVAQRADANYPVIMQQAADTITALRAENEKLRAVLALYREAVRIDATMEGPKFMGSNASALKRAWDANRAAMEGSDD